MYSDSRASLTRIFRLGVPYVFPLASLAAGEMWLIGLACGVLLAGLREVLEYRLRVKEIELARELTRLPSLTPGRLDRLVETVLARGKTQTAPGIHLPAGR